jgi:hypothetical protein
MSIHRRSLATYLALARHLDQQGSPKTLTQIALDIGTTRHAVRRWLRRDHWELWMEHWASVEEIWEEAFHEQQDGRHHAFGMGRLEDPLRVLLMEEEEGRWCR